MEVEDLQAGAAEEEDKRRRLIGEEMQEGTGVTQFDEQLWQWKRRRVVCGVEKE